MRNAIRIVAALSVSIAALGAHAQAKPCTPADSAKAEKAADRVVNGEQLYKAWQDYGHCDAGNVDDIFTDAILRIMIEWKNVDALAKPMESDKAYREFIHKHLNSPSAKGDIDNVYNRAKLSCPKGLDHFCSDITMTVKPFAGMEEIKISTEPAPAAAAPAASPKK
jgi:hypothetical protein